MYAKGGPVDRSGSPAGRLLECFLDARCALFLLVLLGLLLPTIACSQYYGRNKIQYHDYDFDVLHTPNFQIYFYDDEKVGVPYAARMAERWYARHSALLGDSLHGTQPLILYANFTHFSGTNVVQGISQGTGGVTEPLLRRMVLPFAGSLQQTSHVIGHELVHAFQYNMARRGPGGGEGLHRIPLWFIEGMAEYLTIGPIDPNTAMWMREAVRKDLPTVSDLRNPKFFPYRYGQALASYIGGRWGDRKLVDLLQAAILSGNIDSAIDSVLLVSPDSLSRDWHAALRAQYEPLQKVTSRPEDYGRRIIKGEEGESDLNVSPVISPDGKHFVFFSSRDLFSIDLYLAEVATGKVTKKLLKTALDPHLEGLEFISSAGSWDPPGERFVFAAVRTGQPVLQIVNVSREKDEQEIPFRGLGEIVSPAWSPDGKSIAFSALQGGVSDLFLYDLESKSLRRLTDDPFADLQPAWSPDSRDLVFSSDRFTTDLSDLDLGSYELNVLHLDSGRIERLSGFNGAKNINPQFSPDGRSIYWISDRNGVPNLYRMDRQGGNIAQITNFYGGVTGITALSPAMSVAARSDQLLYSDYDGGNYNIWEIDLARFGAGGPPSDLPLQAAVLPPAERLQGLLVRNLGDPHFGLPPETSDFAVKPYRPSFKLVGAGQLELGAGTGPYGSSVGGGVALFFTDMLGNRNLVTALGIQGARSTSDISAFAGYSNTGHRLYWGGSVQQAPYLYLGLASDYGTVDGEEAYIEQEYLYRQTDREVVGSVSYPFNPVLRTDVSAGFRNISFDQEVNTRAWSLQTGGLILDQQDDLSAPKALNLGMGSAALVYDNSVVGAITPVLGRRWYLEAAPSVGSLSWVDMTGDLRQYLMPLRPFTLAGRLLHFGRYGGAAENEALSPLYLGYPGLVRGYNQGFFGTDEGGAFSTTDSTITFDRLYGSRLLVGNVELRFPLFGLLGLGRGYYGALPVELAAFYDTGVAWRKDQEAWFLGGSRRLISSVGGALRVNVLGYAIAEIDYVLPLDDPDRTWAWQFNFVQGF